MRRRDVEAVRRRFPWEAGAGETKARGGGTRGVQATNAVLEHRASGRWVRCSEEREHEDVAVPEDVSAVADPESPRAPTGASPSSATVAIRWKSAKRIAS